MPTESRRRLWIVLVIAALTALHMARRDAVVVTVTAWLASQAIGFGLLGYPRDFSTYAWGMTLGVAGLATLDTACVIAGSLGRLGEIAVTVTAFAGAFAAVLSSNPADFAPAVVPDVLRVNAISLAVLLVLRRLGTGIGLVTRQSVPARAPAA